jgi:hypothetical protein
MRIMYIKLINNIASLEGAWRKDEKEMVPAFVNRSGSGEYE